MTPHKPPEKPLHGIRAMFLVWSHPQGAHRSEFFAEVLGMRLQYVFIVQRNGLLWALFKYPVQALQTAWVLARFRPRLVFVQDPPTFAAFAVWLCSLVLPRLRLIIDSHTQRNGLVIYPFLLPMRQFLARRALANIVTNPHLAAMVAGWGGTAVVMEDPPLPFIDQYTAHPLDGEFNVVWVNIGAEDEPRPIFFETARRLPHITFYVTSDYTRNTELQQWIATASENVRFTGHLPDVDFYDLLKSADVVMTLTTWDHTLQQGACEAMWLGRPVITSDWEMLRRYFTSGALFVDNTVESLVSALETMRTDYETYARGIRELDALRRADWAQQVENLMAIIRPAFDR